MLPKDYNARKALPIFTFLTEYFPDAILELVKVSVAGNIQHNPGEKLHWARGKSMDQLNTAMRHQFDHGMGNVFDEESEEVQKAIGGNTMHLAKAAWRLLAEIQLIKERNRMNQGCERVAQKTANKPLCFDIGSECNVMGQPLGDRLVGYDRGGADCQQVALAPSRKVPSAHRQLFDPQG